MPNKLSDHVDVKTLRPWKPKAKEALLQTRLDRSFRLEMAMVVGSDDKEATIQGEEFLLKLCALIFPQPKPFKQSEFVAYQNSGIAQADTSTKQWALQ